MRVAGFAGALVLLVLAGAAAMLAADVRSWERTMRSDDALLAAAPGKAIWRPRTHMPFALAARVLGTSDDVAARRAIALFRATVSVSVQTQLEQGLTTVAARSRAEDALAGVARSGNRAHASQAETLLGILTFGDLAPAGADQLLQGPAPPTPDQAEAAIGDFQRASRDDPENTPAKFNLELLLRILTAQGVRIGGNNQAGIGATGKRRAGGGGPGSGY